MQEPHPVDILYVGEALGLASVPVHNDAHISDLACTGEEREKLLLSRPQG